MVICHVFKYYLFHCQCKYDMFQPLAKVDIQWVDLRETKCWTLLMPVLCLIVCFHLLLSGHFSYTVGFEKCEVNHGLEQRHRLLGVTGLTQKMALLGEDI